MSRSLPFRTIGTTVFVSLVGAAAKGVPGEVIYSNPQGFRLLRPGTGVRVADDLEFVCTYGEITGLTVGVSGGGTGIAPGFVFTVELFDGCPSDGGQVIPDSVRTIQVRDDGAHYVYVDYSDGFIPIERSAWLALTFFDDSAGVIVGNKPELGRSVDAIDHIDPCSTQLSSEGDHPYVFANFDAIVRAENVVPAYVAYAADHRSNFFLPIGGPHDETAIADDIQAVTRPGEGCAIVDYTTSWAGLEGPYCTINELWTDDPDSSSGRPLAPIPGTLRDCCADPETCQAMFDPPIQTPPGRFWISYEPQGNRAGPLLNAGFPSIGMSEHCFSVFGSPDPDVWSPCGWIYPGCEPGGPDPCAVFVGAVTCAGTEPTGACCKTSATAPSCVDNIRASQCRGRFAEGVSCDQASFAPPCELAACCDPTGVCVDRSFEECRALGGLWKLGEQCHGVTQTCPQVACLIAGLPCDQSHELEPGCNDVGCCDTVCEIDSFCCVVGWDDTCVALATDFCNGATECPASPVFFLDPPNGVVDARQPHALGDPTPQGISSIRVYAPGGLNTGCVSICTPGAVPVTVAAINYVSAGEYELVLSRPLGANQVWQVAYNADDGSRTALTMTSHPGNVNGDDWASPIDVLALINCLNGVNLDTDCPYGLYSTDIDRSGAFNPADILRLLDLLFGADDFDEWFQTKKRDPLCAD